MIANLCFELVSVAVGLVAIAVDFLDPLMIVRRNGSSTLDRCKGSADFCFELVAVAVGLAAIAVDFLNSLGF